MTSTDDATMTNAASKPRILLVQAEGFPAPDPPALPVGVVRDRHVPERLVLIVKATLTRTPGGTLDWAPSQLPLSTGQASWLPGARPDELGVPDDFVSQKEGVDVLLVGHAHAAQPTHQIEALLRTGSIHRPLLVRASAPATTIPLSAAYLAPADPCGPLAAHGNAAPTVQRSLEMPPDAVIELWNLLPGGGRAELRLPGLSPWLSVSPDGGGTDEQRATLRLDTVWIDTDRGVVTLVWRGAVELFEDLHERSRIALSIERAGHERTEEARRSALMRGHFGFAVRAEDTRLALTEEDAERLQAARYMTWQADAPPPRLSLDAYAAIAAELAEQPNARAATLARHALDEDRFAIEERAWLEAIARSAMEGDASLAEQHALALERAQAALARPGEVPPLERFLEIRGRLGSAEDALAVLREYGLSLPRWMRIERHWLEAAERDMTVRAAIERDDAQAAAREEVER
jgi:hypothetical protein